ncbi:MAG: hypothetical protein P8Y23_04350 [Candidatus Lokiarchaeota archaeon]|jgi:hypothetical protein
MEIDPLIVTNGISSLIVSIISFVIGVKLAIKYYRRKERTLILVGLTWLIMYEGWWGPSVSFLLLVLTNHPLPIELFFIISMSLIPLGITFWMIVFTDLKWQKYQKAVTIIFTIQIPIYEILSFYYLFTDSSSIVVSVGVIDAQYKSFIIFFFIEIAILLIITGYFFAKESLKLEKRDMRLKGIFLLVGFISLVIGATLDVFLELEIVTLIIYRLILVFSSFIFYFGFFLPKSIKLILKRS